MRKRYWLAGVVVLAIAGSASLAVLLSDERHATKSEDVLASARAVVNGRLLSCPKPRHGRFVGADVCLPSGNRLAYYDRTRDAVWIVSNSYDEKDLSLVRIDARSGASVTQSMVADMTWFGNGSAISGLGSNLWMTWGTRLYRYDVDAEKLEGIDIPPPPKEHVLVHTSGWRLATGLSAAGGRIWITRSGVTDVIGWNPSGRNWTLVPTPGFVAYGSVIATLPDQRMMMGGASRLRGGRELFGFLDPRTLKVTLKAVNVSGRSAIREDGMVFRTDLEGRSFLVNPETGSARRLSVVVRGTSSGLPPFAGKGTTIWMMDSAGGLRLDLIAIDSETGSVERFEFPLEIARNERGVCGFGGRFGSPATACPTAKPISIDIRSLVVDRRGSVWIVTGHGNTGAEAGPPYPAVYRFTPPATALRP